MAKVWRYWNEHSHSDSDESMRCAIGHRLPWYKLWALLLLLDMGRDLSSRLRTITAIYLDSSVFPIS
jgi:hypothetical protein